VIIGDDLEAEVLVEQQVEEAIEAESRFAVEPDGLFERAGDVGVGRSERRRVSAGIRCVQAGRDQGPAEAQLELELGRGQGGGGPDKEEKGEEKGKLPDHLGAS
jgi:hypothetical protein